ncbi:MAG: nucleotidyltransferase domain-containing protein [Deltaproteobacteria bacterium]|nr:nucleotidyltransferase domain-containing protein [Deltaproteobacteria bacterium]
MIPKRDLNKAVELAKKYHIGKLYLVGSALHGDPQEANDYDFAVDEYPPDVFFSFYGELMRTMPKPVDLINLSGRKMLFEKLVMRDGLLIYDAQRS